MPGTEIFGSMYGTRLVPRSDGQKGDGTDRHILVQLLSRKGQKFLHDDGSRFSQLWLPDLLEVLERTKILLETYPQEWDSKAETTVRVFPK